MDATTRNGGLGCLVYSIWILAALLSGSICYGAGVSEIFPRTGSKGGGTKLTILGTGFSTNQFTLSDDPGAGNQVYLVSTANQYRCPVIKESSSDSVIVCNIPSELPDTILYARVVVDGQPIEEAYTCGGRQSSYYYRCRYTPSDNNTPKIWSLEPHGGVPGTLLTISGKLMEDRNVYADGDSEFDQLDNTLTFRRVHVGDHFCHLEENGHLYGIEVSNSNNGYLKCKTTGKAVGFYNISYQLDAPYGRSVIDASQFRVSYNDQAYLYQMYTEITNISHAIGSAAGGLTLTIYGKNFRCGSSLICPKAYIEDTVCEITDVVTDDSIVCIVAAEPETDGSTFKGNRGAIFEYWTLAPSNYQTLNDILTLSSTDQGYNSMILDETYFENSSLNYFASRMTSFFTPPHTGEYQFYLLANGNTQLFLDGSSKISNFKSMNWMTTHRITLVNSKKYLLKIVQRAGFKIHLKVKYFETRFTHASVEKAEDEVQTISIKSTVSDEIQKIRFSGFTNQKYESEVQNVDIDTNDEFRFGIHGVFTEPLMNSMPAISIQNAFDKLPIWGSDESVTVVKNETNPGSYQLTFNSKRGDFPDIDVVSVDGIAQVNYSVLEEIRGVPDLDTVALELDGVVSEPFSVSSVDSGNTSLKDVLLGMFDAKCPVDFQNDDTVEYYENFETYSSWFGQYRIRSTDAFCGKYILKSPKLLYQRQEPISLAHFGTICFAYKGAIRNGIRVKYTYVDFIFGHESQYELEVEHYLSQILSTNWLYTCVDINSAIVAANPLHYSPYLDTVQSSGSSADFYIDCVSIRRSPITDTRGIHLRRLRPALTGKEIRSVDVIAVSPNMYEITLIPAKCIYNFPMIELANSNVQNIMTNFSSFAYGSGENSAMVDINRISEASPPVTGSIYLTFKGKEKGLNVSLRNEELKRDFESLEGIGAVEIDKGGDCYNFHIKTKFLTQAGNQPQLQVKQTKLHGKNPSCTVTTNTDGGLYYDPIAGDMLSTSHETPQVRLYINGVPTKCSGDCSFTWDPSVTPEITSATPLTGHWALGSSIVIYGRGFSDVNSENNVTIGDTACLVTASDEISISCNVGNGSAGTASIRVKVDGKGYAKGNVEYVYTANITSIYPQSGSLGGGVVLTVLGFGFSSDASVTINDKRCEVKRLDSNTIQCVVSQNKVEGTFTVMVDQGTKTLSYSGFKYDSSITAKVDNVSPEKIGGWGGNLTIIGTAFTQTAGSVTVGLEDAVVISWSNTEIQVLVSEIDPGLHEIRITTQHGFAVNTSNLELPKVYSELVIHDVYPRQGSLLGGTELTISGSGFGNTAPPVKVTVGAAGCSIGTISNTQIICTIEYTGLVHHVTNKGVNPAFGVFYEFDPLFITINEGDFVQWSWETPFFVNDIAHSIIEVESPSSLIARPGGINSGQPSRNGYYVHRFNQAGTYYIWSGYVDVWNIKNYVGTVKVVHANSTLEEINVLVGKIKALHGLNASMEERGPTCNSHITVVDDCEDGLNQDSNSNKFNFAFCRCLTPVVNTLTVNNGTIGTNVKINGQGFSFSNEENEVYFDRNKCYIVSSTDRCIDCNFERKEEPNLGIIQQIELNVNSLGVARINIRDAKDSGFALLPSVEDITPLSGSLAGGTELSIIGFGLGGSTLVLVDHHECAKTDNSDFHIFCETPPSSTEGSKEIEVFVFVGDVPLKVALESNSDNSSLFSYDSNMTPVIEFIHPQEMSKPTSFYINGSMFGKVKQSIEVTFGGVKAQVEEAADTYVIVSVNNIPAGENVVVLKVHNYGKARGSFIVNGTLSIFDVSPLSGSVYGGTKVTVQGNGFIENNSSVTFGGVLCDILTTNLFQITCVTRAHFKGSFEVKVFSAGFLTLYSSYSYSLTFSPTISVINQTSGYPGDVIKIVGSNLGGNNVTVFLGLTICKYIAGNDDEISCTVGNHSTGRVPVSVFVSNLGASNTNVYFNYELSIKTIVPSQGSTGGGQTVVVSGTGFESTAVVTICGQVCLIHKATFSSYTCKTIAHEDEICDVVITLNGLERMLPRAYKYNGTLTPSVTNVSPRRGGTGGGTKLTITGSGFGSVSGSISVEIDGTVCRISSVTETKIECLTGRHARSVDTQVDVVVAGYGIAKEFSDNDASFRYIDLWSSVFTWGGEELPQDGEFVVIPNGVTILLDINTPVLSVLLIQGNLIFDEKDIELQSNIILITDGGNLQVGTEDKPFHHNALITLHGHVRSKELPIYGAKVLAVRNGTLDLHGTPVSQTWTRLSSTALAGDVEIHLNDPVGWKAGDEIAISTTGNFKSQAENERKTIFAVSEDKLCLTLNSPLEADHLSSEENFEGTVIAMRAEVGLLTHNVIVKGNAETKRTGSVLQCNSGVNIDEFTSQTCFSDDVRRNQFGANIIVHAAAYNSLSARVRISYTEIKFAGQALRQGRHPVFFYLNGDMSTSYIRGCSIHNTYNRAINIQGSHNLLVERTVFYDIKGIGVYLEDGIETGNILQNNLAILIKASSQLDNDDAVASAFLITNPNNTVQHNAVAGGTHFGYWYKPKSHPDGPSFTKTISPKNIPLGIFRNNSAHSFGRCGLRIFKNYFPHNNIGPKPAHFESVYLWKNYKGVEVVNSFPMHFDNFALIDNELAGFECNMFYDVCTNKDVFTIIKNSQIVGNTNLQPNVQNNCTKSGIVLPYGRGFRILNVTFINFANLSCAALRWIKLKSFSSDIGGFTYATEQLNFINVTNIAAYEWEWEGIIYDKDGTATGKSANWTVLPSTGSLPNDCEYAPRFSAGVPASMCPPQHKWHRFAFTTDRPMRRFPFFTRSYHYTYYSRYLRGKQLTIANEYGNSTVMYQTERLTYDYGWMCVLLDGSSYTIHFEPEERRNNLSLSGRVYDFEVDDYIFLKIKVKDFPDHILVGRRESNNTEGGINTTTAASGDWEWINTDKAIQFIVKDDREDPGEKCVDIPFSLFVIKCFFKDCTPPPDPNTVAPVPSRPLSFYYWHDISIWNRTSDGYMTDVGEIGIELPQDYDNVRILYSTWVLVNKTDTFKLGILLLEGVLEFLDFPGAVFEIEADFIIIKGGRLIIGWPNDPFDGLATITLRGNQSVPHFDLGSGKMIGPRSIAVYGGLDLIGRDVGKTWTQLDNTAKRGSRTIKLIEQVKWKDGDKIVISSTNMDPMQAETFRIKSVHTDNVTLTLHDSIRFKHIVHIESLKDKKDISLRAGVGLLTRNIKIIGHDDVLKHEKSFGAYIKVGEFFDGRTYTGYARLINVEVLHTGQKESNGVSGNQPKNSLLFNTDGRHVTIFKPSIVTKCSFHHGSSTAVSALDINDLEISNNVIFDHPEHGIVTASLSTRLNNNFIVSTRMNGIEASRASNLVLENNFVTGAGKIGYHVPAVNCDDTETRNNKMFNSGIGGLFTDFPTGRDCVKVSGFTCWKSLEVGVLYIGRANVKIVHNNLIENQIGLGVVVTSKGPLESTKYVVVQNTTFIGQTSSFDCSSDNRNPGMRRVISPVINTRLFNARGMFGMVFPHFLSVRGITTLVDVTFSKYENTTCKKNFAVTTNVEENYNQAPVDSERATVINVAHSNKIIFQRPFYETAQDCSNMNCAVFKYVIFRDRDGSFLGHSGSVVPKSEYGRIDERRVPVEMVTDLDGQIIPFEQIASKQGIVRNENCVYREYWQAYECYADINYEFLKIQNMDADARTRQISPVALLSEGYIDLLDVPLDHINCKQYYKCRQIKSTFYALVATGKYYLMHFTGTTPRHMQYNLLNGDLTEGLKLTVWYSRPSRLDVFVNGIFVIATNARIDQVGRYILRMPIGNEYEPHISNETGTNYFDRTRGEITIVIKGPARIDVITQNTIIVSFGLPALTVSEFFGKNIIEILAAFFDIPLTKVRIVNIVSETTQRRYKRSDPTTTVEIEIGDEPVQDMNSTLSDSVDLSTLEEIASYLVNECQMGNISDILEFSVVCETIGMQTNDSGTDYVVYETVSPSFLFFDDEPKADYEGALLKIQPKIRAADVDNNTVPHLGTLEYPWQMTVTLRDDDTGQQSDYLSGTASINASWGWFNFTDLVISAVGSNYILDFNVTYPEVAKSFTLSSKRLEVVGRPLKIHVYNKTTTDIFSGDVFEVELELQDLKTDEVINNIGWRNHTWSAEVDMLSSSPYGSLNGNFNTSFDVINGRALFQNLSFTGFGIYFLKFTIVSEPPEYNLILNHRMTIHSIDHVNATIEETVEMKVKLRANFEDLFPTEDKRDEFEQMILTEYANIWNSTKLINGSISNGSVNVALVITGSKSDVSSTVYGICETIHNGTQFEFDNKTLQALPYMTVNEITFYGVKCGEIANDKEPGQEDHTLFLVILVAGAVTLFLVPAVIFLIWKHSTKSKMRIHDYGTKRKYSDNGHKIICEDVVFGEEAFCGVAANYAQPPLSTTLDNKKFKRTLSNFSLRIESPSLQVTYQDNKVYHED